MKKFYKHAPEAILVLVLFWQAAAFAASRENVEEKDRNGDGRKETKIYYVNGQIVRMGSDINNDKKADETVTFKNGVPDHGEKDTNFDGKIDTWTDYDASGYPVLVAKDKRGHGKPDTWIHAKNGSVEMREWDRNFDGKPDFRSKERGGHLIEKQYDNNFDGKFEKIEKAPQKGTILKTQTRASQ